MHDESTKAIAEFDAIELTYGEKWQSFKYFPFEHNDVTINLIERYCTTRKLKDVIDNYGVNPDNYVYKYKTSVNGKLREIITYQPTPEGQRLRQLHRMFAMLLEKEYKFHQMSFAYQKGKSIDLCLNQHIKSSSFLKTDVKSYFDSIKFDCMYEKLLQLQIRGVSRTKLIYNILQTCFYENRLPIGFVSSPILSDVYLHDLDVTMGKLQHVHYTRYADDIIVSTSGPTSIDKLNNTLEVLKREISSHQLELNKKKTYIRQLNQEGDAIHLFGLNIVKTKGKNNRITVSNQYIVDTSKRFCSLLNKKSQLEQWELRKEFATVAGRISFIGHASNESAQKLARMIRVKSGQTIDLSYDSLVKLIIGNRSLLTEYEIEKKVERIRRDIASLIELPDRGRIWERIDFPNKNSSQRSSLCLYLYSICRLYKNQEACDVKFNRLDLYTDGQKISYRLPEDVESLRLQIRRIRENPELKARYSADYEYDYLEHANVAKNGNGFMKDGFRPYALYYMSYGTSIIYGEDKHKWYFVKGDKPFSSAYNQKAFLSTDVKIINKHSLWETYLKSDIHWPFDLGEELNIEINKTVQSLIEKLADVKMEYELLPTSIAFKGEMNVCESRRLSDLIDIMKNLSSLVKQADGNVNIAGWCIPYGFLETSKETILDYVELSSRFGKLEIRRFEG